MSSIPFDPKLNRKKPSKKYTKLLEEYVKMHESGKGMFNGKSLTKFIYIIDNFLKSNKCSTLLDYGSGKGTLYGKDFKELFNLIDKPLKEYWNLDVVDLYEPALPEYSTPPTKNYDAVICTDVLEHVPETDLGWVVDEILDHADKMVFLNIACYPARKTFLDGSNVHISIFSPDDWLTFFKDKIKDHKNLSVYIFFEVMREEGKTVSLEGYKISSETRVIQLKQQEEK